MRRLLSLGLAPLALALALMLPTSTFAFSPYGYVVHKNYCTSYPANVFKLIFYADGTTNANKLTIDSKGQSGTAGNWVTYETWPRASITFAAHTNDSFAVQRKYLGDAFSGNRVVFTLRAWHNSTVLYSQKVISKTC
jgi:hypothetical protein